MPRANAVLAALDPARRHELEELGHVVPLRLRATLARPGEALTQILFPYSGAISLVTVLSDGESIEAGVIGREGMLGPVGPLAEPVLPWRVVVQMAGEALAVPAASVAARPALVAALQPLERRNQTALHWLAALSIACNRFHTLDQRCARWLLTLHDRADGDTLVVTHAFLSEMLGARRQSVTRALSVLARAGLIEQPRRSEVRIVNRRGLERAACECYERMQQVMRQGF